MVIDKILNKNKHYYLNFSTFLLSNLESQQEGKALINERVLINFYGILSEQSYNNLLKAISSLFRMGNQTSLCGQVVSHSLQPTNVDYLQDVNNVSTMQNVYPDPLRKFLTSSSALKIKTLNNIINIPKQNENHKEQSLKQASQTFEQQIACRVRRQTVHLVEKENDYELIHVIEEEIQKLAKEKSEKGENVNLNDIDRQKVFKKLRINLSKFIKISHTNIRNFYSFKEIVGEGTFGKVYRALCKRTKEERAIKVLKHQKQQGKFLTQFSLLSQLDHPNIVKLYQIFYYKSYYYVVMEFCRGGSMIDLIKNLKQFPELLVMGIAQQLLAALAYLHQKGIVHRDIKLDNIVFLDYDHTENDYHIKIIDFGTAINVNSYNKKIAGTRYYMSPEAFKGALHQKSDVWSVGIFLYIFFTGVFPFKGKTLNDIEFQVNNKAVTFSQPQWKEISLDARKLILAMLQRNPEKRVSASEALNYPWFRKNLTAQKITYSACNLQLLEKYQRGNNLISIIESFLSLSAINQKDRQRLAVIFKRIDTNNDGSIEPSELMAMFNEHFGGQNEEEVKKILQKLDQNQSGKIDFNEFLVAMYTRKKLFLQNTLIDAFNHYDVDHDGYLQKSELIALLQGCDREQIEYLLDELDQNGDEKVSQQQFLIYMRKFQ